MDAQTAYEYIKKRLNSDFESFEQKSLQMINKYQDDYLRFIKILDSTILTFCSLDKETGGYYLNNTFVDALFKYLCVRDMLRKKKKEKVFIFEFSPFRGWSTYVIAKAMRDSGHPNVKLLSCDISKNAVDITKQHLYLVRKYISRDNIEVREGDAIRELAKLESKSVDLMFVDSDHGQRFTRDYIRAGVFDKCKPDAYIHIHDFIFWLHGCPEKYQEPEVVAEFISNHENRFSNYCFGQLFTLLGGTNTHEELLKVRRSKPDPEVKYFSNSNFFIRNNLPEQFWRGGTIGDVNQRGVHKNKTWVSGLALWMIPNG